MKIFILISFLIIGQTFANEYRCQIVLNGEQVYPDNLIIPEAQNEKDCIVKAKKLFQKNRDVYNKLYLLKANDELVEININED